MKKHFKRGELALLILKGLAVGGFIVVCVALPGFVQVFTLFKTKNARDRHRVRQSIRGLEGQKYIRRYKHKGREIIEITEKGKRRILKYDLENISIKKLKKWDGIWRVVMFDIPEEKRGARLFISRQFNDMGLKTLQRSIFISPFPCKDEVDFVGEYLNVRKYIVYMEVRGLEGSDKWKKYFKLS